ncbi:O-methyltransferase [Saxibacter everestensis]|uniref:O-methyltransferase n=1 Tax=Saxibacter everestensis TaxID=2909229 RepID=A0ABY8QX05_9MICO|nr:O-methyltransferase [Brevibacteriaceae bacterium ZFBP1038]
MTNDQWTSVDSYLADLLVSEDSILVAVHDANAAAGLPSIDVSPVQGKFLMLLAQISGARSVLEIGTLGGYSTIWLARGTPVDSRIVTLEAEPKHAEIARSNFGHAGLADRIEIRIGPALETLPQLAQEGAGPFDLVFIDADKRNNPHYLEWAMKLTRPGSIIVCDNIVRDGQVADQGTSDPDVRGVRRFLEMTAEDERLDATAVQTVGSKGWDGFSIARVR